MDMKDLHERTGAAIQRAAKDLPEGYEIKIDIENGAGTVRLFCPPLSDSDNYEAINEFHGDDIAYEIENAIGYAVDRHSSGN